MVLVVGILAVGCGKKSIEIADPIVEKEVRDELHRNSTANTIRYGARSLRLLRPDLIEARSQLTSNRGMSVRGGTI